MNELKQERAKIQMRITRKLRILEKLLQKPKQSDVKEIKHCLELLDLRIQQITNVTEKMVRLLYFAKFEGFMTQVTRYEKILKELVDNWTKLKNKGEKLFLSNNITFEVDDSKNFYDKLVLLPNPNNEPEIVMINEWITLDIIERKIPTDKILLIPSPSVEVGEAASGSQV